MKKVILIFMVFCLPIIANAGKYKVLIEGTNTNEYQDSIIGLSIDISDNLEYATLIIHNNYNDRIYVEWNGVRITGCKISFIIESQYSDVELLTRNQISIKTICRTIPIVEKKKIKQTGSDYFILSMPITLQKHNHDISLRCVVIKNSGD